MREQTPRKVSTRYASDGTTPREAGNATIYDVVGTETSAHDVDVRSCVWVDGARSEERGRKGCARKGLCSATPNMQPGTGPGSMFGVRTKKVKVVDVPSVLVVKSLWTPTPSAEALKSTDTGYETGWPVAPSAVSVNF